MPESVKPTHRRHRAGGRWGSAWPPRCGARVFPVTGCDVSDEAVARFVADGGGGAGDTGRGREGGRHRRQRGRQRRADRNHPVRQGWRPPKPWPGMPCSSRPRPWTRMSRGGWRNNWKRAAGIISTRRFPAARSARHRVELTILASGSPAAFAKARPALDAMAAKLYELGDAAGAGRCVQDDQPVARGACISPRLRRRSPSQPSRTRYQEGLRGDHRIGRNSWMFENRVPHVLDGDYAPRSAVGNLRQGPRHHPGHGAHR